MLDEGDLLAGDLLMGGYLGGYVLERTPGLTYFIDDLGQNLASIRAITELSVNQVYVGHGGPLDIAQIRRKFGEATPKWSPASGRH